MKQTPEDLSTTSTSAPVYMESGGPFSKDDCTRDTIYIYTCAMITYNPPSPLYTYNLSYKPWD